ncbi:UNVERIFIED_ORG: HK97 family phage major capsid protein/HK97 family phage prohead protease [Xanthobacter viscosus]|uniref:Phage major capsid protein n=1 Tax=Xanthobacter autotrophicus TaxID=280 RepID=A0A6C1KKW2_XANAU|nr:phage major capsid protein [Xanthobacter autotrophicus]TLX44805.1 phage major capsid protein [Xanthobacter autotrophicus]
MNRLETKAAFSAQPTGEISGIAWVFGLPDGAGDVIEKGAIGDFTGLPILYQHDTAQRIGTWVSAEETDLGLIVKGVLDIASNSIARRVHAAVKAGKLTGLSMGFNRPAPHEMKARPEGGRVFSKIHLVEISVVPVPSHGSARILETKSAKGTEVDDLNTEHDDTNTADLSALETKMVGYDTELSGIKADLAKIAATNAQIQNRLSRPGIITSKGADETKAAEQKAFATYLRFGNAAPADELKTLQVSTDTMGGYFAPAEVSAEFVRNLVEFSPIRAYASVRPTSSPSVIYPKRTGITNAKWKGELQASEGSEPSFGQLEIPVRELTTHVDISNQLLADSAGAALAEVNLALSEDFGKKEGAAFLNGDGVLQPMGLLSDPNVTALDSVRLNALDPNDFVALKYALPDAYRQRGIWLMNSTTLATIRSWQTADGLSLWQPSFQEGQPETILGQRVVEVPDMQDPEADAFPILFGDIATAYRIIDRGSLSTLVNPYVRAEFGETRIHATVRVGAGVIQPAAIKKLRIKPNI